MNQAVNNLLSRDDDDGGRDGEHEDNLISFLHSGGKVLEHCLVKSRVCFVACTSEELLNLLGSGSLSGLAEEELEDVLGRREETAGRESRAGMYDLSDPMVQVRVRGGGGGGIIGIQVTLITHKHIVVTSG